MLLRRHRVYLHRRLHWKTSLPTLRSCLAVCSILTCFGETWPLDHFGSSLDLNKPLDHASVAKWLRSITLKKIQSSQRFKSPQKHVTILPKVRPALRVGSEVFQCRLVYKYTRWCRSNKRALIRSRTFCIISAITTSYTSWTCVNDEINKMFWHYRFISSLAHGNN